MMYCIGILLLSSISTIYYTCLWLCKPDYHILNGMKNVCVSQWHASCMYLAPRIWSIVCMYSKNPTNHNMCRKFVTVMCSLFRIFTLAIHSTINESRHDKFVYGTTMEQFTLSYRHLYNLLTSILLIVLYIWGHEVYRIVHDIITAEKQLKLFYPYCF